MSTEREVPTIDLSKKNLVEIIHKILHRDSDQIITSRYIEHADIGEDLTNVQRDALDEYFNQLDAIKKCPECGQELPEDD